MIKSKSYNVTLDFEEVAAVEAYQRNGKVKSFCTLVNGASFSASCNGVTVNCTSDKQACELWDAVLIAMPDDDGEPCHTVLHGDVKTMISKRKNLKTIIQCKISKSGKRRNVE